MGRPEKAPEDRHSEKVTIYLRPGDLAAAKKEATFKRQDLAEWVRWLIIDEIERGGKRKRRN